ncbi:MAG: hypothetical protein NVS9B4_17980 [Candidatus Acidiferrum sp.]
MAAWTVGHPRDPEWVILNYHGISPDQRELFSRQMDCLVRCAKAIPADSSTRLEPGHRYASVTFDDGLANLIENALPKLRQRGIPAAVFVVAGKFGQCRDWPVYNAGSPENERMFTAEELKAVSKDVVVGSHTLTHPILTQVSEEQVYDELEGSCRVLEDILNQKIALFSFPYGAFNKQVVTRCRQAGYTRAFTTLPSLSVSDEKTFLMGRVPVDPNDWALEFRLKLFGAYRWLPVAFAAKRRLLGFLGRFPDQRFSEDS